MSIGGGRGIYVRLRNHEEIMIGIGSNLPPGATGQHVSKNYWWWRVAGGEWQKAGSLSGNRLMEIAEISDSVAEFEGLLEIA